MYPICLFLLLEVPEMLKIPLPGGLTWGKIQLSFQVARGA